MPSILEIDAGINEAQNLIDLIGNLIATPCMLSAVQLDIAKFNHGQAEKVLSGLRRQLKSVAKFAYGDDDRNFNRDAYCKAIAAYESVNVLTERLAALTTRLNDCFAVA
ncbi:hypothetical protein IJF89_02010 [Candidatus Saccharibacteria bacterium]|nr:hypothetical protein [Candidatus Saccharibacteria bacterium]